MRIEKVIYVLRSPFLISSKYDSDGGPSRLFTCRFVRAYTYSQLHIIVFDFRWLVNNMLKQPAIQVDQACDQASLMVLQADHMERLPLTLEALSLPLPSLSKHASLVR